MHIATIHAQTVKIQCFPKTVFEMMEEEKDGGCICVCSLGQETTGLIFSSISSQLSILWADCSLTTDGGPWSALQPHHS